MQQGGMKLGKRGFLNGTNICVVRVFDFQVLDFSTHCFLRKLSYHYTRFVKLLTIYEEPQSRLESKVGWLTIG